MRRPNPFKRNPAPLLGALLASAFVCWLGLREFAFTDYQAEAFPAVDKLVDGDVPGFLTALPGYAGAVILQGPFALLGNTVGPDHDLWAWRAQAVPGIAMLFVIGTLVGTRLSRRIEGRRGAIWGGVAAALVAGSPFALLAQQAGHPEEMLVVGMAVGSVLLAMRGNLLWAAGLVGLAAVAKPWALIAVPVVLLAATDRRTLVKMVVVCALAGAALMSPVWINGGAGQATSTVHASTSGIFKPDNVFWFAGRANPVWGTGTGGSRVQVVDPVNAPWAQRLEPAWAAQVSHPAIIAFAGLLALAFWAARRRASDGHRGSDLLLLLAAVSWWRCLLDTWNVHYYALGAVVALAAWEAARGRPPVVTIGATALGWVTFQLLPGSILTPDANTALYLAWALPLGVGMVWRLLAPASASAAALALGRPLGRRLPTLAGLLRAPGAPAAVAASDDAAATAPPAAAVPA